MFPMTFQALFRRFHYKIFKYLPLFSKKPWEIIGVKEGKISQGRMKFARLLGILLVYFSSPLRNENNKNKPLEPG
jgi:hypothetical protein